MTKINDYHFPALDWDSDGEPSVLFAAPKAQSMGARGPEGTRLAICVGV